MDRVVDSGHVAGPPSGRTIQFAILACLILMAFLAWALEASILLPQRCTEEYRALAALLDAWAVAHLPASILSFVRGMATVALSPLLYLGFAAVFVAANVGSKGTLEAQPCKRYRSIRRIADTFDHFSVVKRNFGTKRHRQPFAAVIVVYHPSFVVKQFYKGVGYDVTDTQDVKLVHAPSFTYFFAYVYCAKLCAAMQWLVVV